MMLKMTPVKFPVLGREPHAHDLGFLDDVVVDEDPGRPAFRVGHVDAVHRVGDPRPVLGAVGRIGHVVRRDSRGHVHEGRSELGVGDVAQKLVGQGHRRGLRGLDVDRGRLGDDRDLLLDGRRLQCEVDGQSRRRGETDVLLDDRLEPLELRLDRVFTGRKRRNPVFPLGVGRCRPGSHQVGARNRHRHTGKTAALFVHDFPDDGAGLLGLREGLRGE